MNKFQQLITAAQFQITGGSEYQWNSFGYTARFLDFNSPEFKVDLSLIFDSETQEVYQATMYINESSFRWTNPSFLDGFKKESYERDIDPRLSSEDTYFTDCDVFDDFVSKVSESFTTGTCDTSVLISLNFTPEQEDIFNQLPEGTDIQEFIITALKEKLDILSKQNIHNWDIVFSTLAQSGIITTIDIEDAPISEKNIQEIYDWVNSLNLKTVELSYSDKDTASGLVCILTANKEENPHLTFKYTFKI